MGVTPTDFPAVNPSGAPGARSSASLDKSALSADRDLRMLIVSSFTDWLAIACMTLLIAIKALGPDFGWSIPALASGTIYAKMRGAKVPGGSTTAMLFLAGPFALKAAATLLGRTVIGAALLLLVGCAGGPSVPPSVLQDARAAVTKGDAALAAVGPHLLNLRKLVIRLCGEPALLPPAECDHAQATFNAIGQGYDDLGQLADTADLVVTFAEAAQGAP